MIAKTQLCKLEVTSEKAGKKDLKTCFNKAVGMFQKEQRNSMNKQGQNILKL